METTINIEGLISNENENIEDYNIFNTVNEYDSDQDKVTKRQIFKINNYNFLKKKREETNEKAMKKRPWTFDEVNNIFNPGH